jgi:hypothetical protein
MMPAWIAHMWVDLSEARKTRPSTSSTGLQLRCQCRQGSSSSFHRRERLRQNRFGRAESRHATLPEAAGPAPRLLRAVPDGNLAGRGEQSPRHHARERQLAARNPRTGDADRPAGLVVLRPGPPRLNTTITTSRPPPGLAAPSSLGSCRSCRHPALAPGLSRFTSSTQAPTPSALPRTQRSPPVALGTASGRSTPSGLGYEVNCRPPSSRSDRQHLIRLRLAG